ncbi:hypothetical protein [Spongiimicrobium salis]|uniref:hypothetical protein n=1 Tax=Spongiimicrobium salis TaxID=1667022 RepID=UPI00374CEC77
MSNKNIDQLFREKLKDFHELPEDHVWNGIEASLDKKKKKRVLPIWWKLGGVAAVLAIVAFSLYPLGTTSSTTNPISDVDQQKESNTSSKEISPISLQKEEGLTQTEMTAADEESKTSNANSSTPIFKASTPKKEALEGPKKNHKNANTLLAHGKGKETPVKKNTAPLTTEDIAQNTLANSENTTATLPTELQKNTGSDQNSITGQKQPLSTEANAFENAVAEATTPKEIAEEDKKSIFDAIAEEEEEIVAENKEKKWAISPSVAPIYFDSFGDGSPIDPSFSPNSKSGNVNLSYGLSVSYNVSKKISVRTGIHRVDYGYNTNDIAFSSSLSTSRGGNLRNIDLDPKSQNIVLQSAVSGETSNMDVSQFGPTSDVSQAFDPALNGRIVQQLGYLEVPFEVNYALVANKWGVNVIGGVSSLFLIDNAISLESQGLITEIGKANNLNMVNFSTNVGLGVHYNFSPKVQWNVEPIFKYQLNTFSGATGNFQPFSLGVYSGFSFKF